MNMHELVCPTPPLNQARRQEQTGCQTKGTRTYTPTYAHTKGPLLHETDPDPTGKPVANTDRQYGQSRDRRMSQRLTMTTRKSTANMERWRGFRV